MFVSVEPASVCQLRCPECPVGQGSAAGSRHAEGDRPFMSMEVWGRVLNEIKRYAHTVQFYFQGEPLLNRDLPQMIREAHDAGLYTIVSTNAQAMTEPMAEALVKAGLDRIIVSMDGLTDESYNAYRAGGSLDKTKEALRMLRTAKVRLHARITIELQVLRLRTNEHEWEEFQRVYRSLGADRLVFKTAQLYDYTHGHPLMPSDLKYSRYQPVAGPDGIRYQRRSLRHGCLRVWSGAVIATNGDVLPCCYDKMRAYAYGNIMNAPMREIYNNGKAQAFRRAAFHQKTQICQECWK